MHQEKEKFKSKFIGNIRREVRKSGGGGGQNTLDLQDFRNYRFPLNKKLTITNKMKIQIKSCFNPKRFILRPLK